MDVNQLFAALVAAGVTSTSTAPQWNVSDVADAAGAVITIDTKIEGVSVMTGTYGKYIQIMGDDEVIWLGIGTDRDGNELPCPSGIYKVVKMVYVGEEAKRKGRSDCYKAIPA
jgi:hypothetical protein